MRRRIAVSATLAALALAAAAALLGPRVLEQRERTRYEDEMRPVLTSAARANDDINSAIAEFRAGRISFGEVGDRLSEAAGVAKEHSGDLEHLEPVEEMATAHRAFAEDVELLAEAAYAYTDYVDAIVKARASHATFDADDWTAFPALGESIRQEGYDAATLANERAAEYERLREEWEAGVGAFEDAAEEHGLDLELPIGFQALAFETVPVDRTGEYVDD